MKSENGSPGEVVVTGAGAVGSYGAGVSALAAALEAGEVPRRQGDWPAGFHRGGGARQAAFVDPEALKAWIPPLLARRMSPPSKFAVAAAKMAWQEAALPEGSGASTAVFVATCFGPCSYSERILQQVFFEGPEAASPMLFTESVANAPAAQIALALQAVGANVTVTQREAGPLMALAQGAAEVASGRASTAVVAAVDEIGPALHGALDRFRALACGDEVPRPLDRRRCGFLLAEGAGALVLESAAAAAARGARPRARLRAVAQAFDPRAPRTAWSRDPTPLAEALGRRLAAAGVALESIDGIVCGASGSHSGDRLEALLLKRVWGPRPLPPLFTPKAVTGEYGGSLLVPAVLILEGVPLTAPRDFEVDPELGLTPCTERSRAPLRRVLVSSLAAGGAACWLILERP